MMPLPTRVQANAAANRSSVLMDRGSRVVTISGAPRRPVKTGDRPPRKGAPAAGSEVIVTGPATCRDSPRASDVSRCSAQSGPAISR